MQTLNKILIISILSITSFCAFAQDTKSDAIFHNIKREYVINEDGSVDFTYRKELELISNRSFFRDFGETFIVYNPEFQTLKINESYTIRKDGSIVRTPENAFNEVLPSGCTDCARYNNMKEMVVTHTALEYNATIVLDYTIHTKPEFITNFMEIINFVEYAPVKNYDVFVKVAQNIELKERMLNLRLGATINKEGDYKTYHWNVGNLGQTISESYMPAYEELYPVLIISTFKDMTNAYFSLVNQESLKTTDLPESKTAIAEIVSTEKSNLENILSIRDYVIDYIRYNNFSLKYNNYQLATPATVWQSRCGNEAEKAVMLACMLNTAGFEAIPVTFTKPRMHSNEIGCLDVISHWGVRVINDGKPLIISPVRKSNVSMDIEFPEYSMYFISATVETFRATNSEKIPTEISVTGNINIALDGKAGGNLSLGVTSSKLPVFSIIKDSAKANDIVMNIKGETSNIKLSEQKISMDLEADNISVTDMKAGYYSFEIPETKYGININPSYLNTERKTEVICGKTNETYKYKITLPAGHQYIGKNVEKIIDKSFGKVIIKITANKNIIEIERSIVINEDRIKLNDYSDFREMMILWNNETYKKFIVK
ncbi:MAG: DUF3857 domain-containing protein [Bacteroidales bacterium]|jgi:hypothetical protein|nr:DUF3857 domain-containing protein [Bacteroidales bacterium]